MQLSTVTFVHCVGRQGYTLGFDFAEGTRFGYTVLYNEDQGTVTPRIIRSLQVTDEGSGLVVTKSEDLGHEISQDSVLYMSACIPFGDQSAINLHANLPYEWTPVLHSVLFLSPVNRIVSQINEILPNATMTEGETPTDLGSVQSFQWVISDEPIPAIDAD